MKSSEKLKKDNLKLRNSIEVTLNHLRHKVKYRFLEENGGLDTPEGFIELNKHYIHNSNDADGNMNEVIIGIHTDENKVQTECGGDVTDNVWLHTVSNENLIAIIEELEGMVENPQTIEILTGEEE